MKPVRIDDAQMDLLASRLAAAGVGRRDFLRIAAGLAALGGGVFTAQETVAAPKLAPGEKLAKEQVLRYGGGGWYHNDPSSHDFNKDLYCSGHVALFVGLMMFNSGFQSVIDVANLVTPHPDGSMYTVRVRKESKWSDGSPCTARDFEYSCKRQLDPATA